MSKHKYNLDDVRDFWDENVCGDVFTSLKNRKSRNYIEETRDNRYRYAYHLKPFLERVSKAGKEILEVGCSQGIDLVELAKMGSRVTGLDLSPRAIELAENRFRVEKVEGNFVCGNAEIMEFPDENFDVVYSCGVLHHTPNIEKALREVKRVLKPGGKLFIMLYSKNSLNNFVHSVFRIPYESPRDLSKDAPITRTFNHLELEKLFEDFANMNFQKEYLFGAGWKPISDVVPTAANRALGKIMGWHWMIDGEKPDPRCP